MSKEHCLICGSANYLTIVSGAELAWECWACLERYWIDDQSKLEYMVDTNRTPQQADTDLMAGKPVFASTQSFP